MLCFATSPANSRHVPVTSGLDTLECFGKGPHETYIDRHRGAWVGRFRGTVDELFGTHVAEIIATGAPRCLRETAFGHIDRSTFHGALG